MITSVQAVQMFKAFAAQFESSPLTTFCPMPEVESQDIVVRILNTVSSDLVARTVAVLQPFQFIHEDDSEYTFALLGVHQNLALVLKPHGPMVWYYFRKMVGTEGILTGNELVKVKEIGQVPLMYGLLPTVLQTPTSCQKSGEVSSAYIRRILQSQALVYRQEVNSLMDGILSTEEFTEFFKNYRAPEPEEAALKQCSARLQKAASVVRYLEYVKQRWSGLFNPGASPHLARYPKYSVQDLRAIILLVVVYDDAQLAEFLFDFKPPAKSVSRLPSA